MSFPPAIGVWVSAFAEPDSVALLVPMPGALRICGQVIGVKPLPPSQPGNIPDCCLTIRGRSGKTMSLSYVAHYVTEHASQAEAVADTKAPAISFHHEDEPQKPSNIQKPGRTAHAPRFGNAKRR